MRRFLIASVALLTACGSATGAIESDIKTPPTPVPTLTGVGSLPETIPATPPKATEPLVVIARPTNSEGDVAALIGEQVAGNRILMIGDSIFAGTETRYGGEMCAGLEPLGWAVEVAAEAGRFVDFGVKVVKRNVPAPSDESSTSDPPNTGDGPVAAGPDDWDAAAVFLGSNYRGNQKEYDEAMREILDRLAPRPTLLYTVTEFRSNYAEVNEVIYDLVDDYPNVTLIDWAEAAKTPGVLRADGLHPNEAGETVLVDLTAAALGDAQSGEADCIRSRFRDDSAIKGDAGSSATDGSSSGSSSTSGGSSSSTSGGSSSGSGSSSTSGGSTTTVPRGSTTGGTPTTTVGGSSTTGGSTTGGTPTTVGGSSTSGGSSTGGTPTTVGGSGGTTSGGSSTSGGTPTTVGGSGGTPTTLGTTGGAP